MTEVPWVGFDERVLVESLGRGCWRVKASFGFKNRIDVPQALELCREQGLAIEPMETSYFLSRETVVPVPGEGGMALWREKLFAALARNAGNAADYFNLPPNRVIELGTKVEI
jgi:KUP system potassium uptake protein